MQCLETKTEILQDRDETWDLRDQDSKKRVSVRDQVSEVSRLHRCTKSWALIISFL